MGTPDQRFAGSWLKAASLHLCPALGRQNAEAESLYQHCQSHSRKALGRWRNVDCTTVPLHTFDSRSDNPNAFSPYLDIIGRKERRHGLRNSFCNQKKLNTTTFCRWGVRKVQLGTCLISCPCSCPLSGQIKRHLPSPTFRHFDKDFDKEMGRHWLWDARLMHGRCVNFHGRAVTTTAVRSWHGWHGYM